MAKCDRFTLFKIFIVFFVVVDSTNGKSVCGAPTPKWVPEGEYFVREQNIPSYTACCHLCNVTATCRSYAYLRAGQTCDMYTSERLVEHVNVNVTGGLILPDGWVSPPPEPTTVNPDPCPINDPGSVRPHPTDCSKFMRCLYGMVYEDRCVPGLWFHMFWLNCTYADRVLCYGNSTASPDPITTTPLTIPTTAPGATTGTTATQPTTTTTVPTTTTLATTTANPEPAPTPSPACQVDCPVDYIGKIANPQNCFLYHDCVYGSLGEAVECPLGQMYDCGLRSCAVEGVAKCSDYVVA